MKARIYNVFSVSVTSIYAFFFFVWCGLLIYGEFFAWLDSLCMHTDERLR